MKQVSPKEPLVQQSPRTKQLMDNLKRKYRTLFLEFKGACYKEELTMSVVLRTFMRQYINNPSKYVEACRKTYLKELQDNRTTYRPKKVQTIILNKASLVRAIAQDVIKQIQPKENNSGR